jgi:putative hydrolase of the HAD superfamily
VAGQVSAWKPDPGLFIHALECLGVPAQSAIYVGDNYYADVVGARRAGVHPVLYDPEGVFPNADCTVIRRIGELDLLAETR